MPTVKELAEMLRSGWAGQLPAGGGFVYPSTQEDDGDLSTVQAVILSKFSLLSVSLAFMSRGNHVLLETGEKYVSNLTADRM